MIIACATDQYFVEPTCVLLASLAANGCVPEARVIVFGRNLSAKEKKNLLTSSRKSPDLFQIIDLKILEDKISRLKISLEVPSVVTYTRIFIPDLIKYNDTLLYLDVDMIVQNSLRDLASLDISKFVAAAVPDKPASEKDLYVRQHLIGLSDPETYFNGGFLFMNLDNWRKSNVTEKSLSSIMKGVYTIYCDQDHLNYGLQGLWMPLGREWNFFPRENEVFSLEGYQNAKIIHFASAVKPWLEETRHPAKELYLFHRKNTPYANTPLISPLKRRFMRFRRTPLKVVTSFLKRRIAF